MYSIMQRGSSFPKSSANFHKHPVPLSARSANTAAPEDRHTEARTRGFLLNILQRQNPSSTSASRSSQPEL